MKKSAGSKMAAICFLLLILIGAAGCEDNQSENNVPIIEEAGGGMAINAETAEINIDTKDETAIELGMRGVNNEMTFYTCRFDDEELIQKANEYKYLGFIRWSAIIGNNNWKTGTVDEENFTQYYRQKRNYDPYWDNKQVTEAKGYDRIDHFRYFLKKTGQKAVMIANVWYDSPEQAGDLARYCRQNNIPVIYWELGNEVAYHTGNTGKMAAIFKDTSDYIQRAKVYNDVIKKEYPGVKTIIQLSNEMYHPDFDNEIFNYPEPYWDGVAFHRYEGDGKNFQEAILNANKYLDEWIPTLDDYYISKLKDKSTPVFIGEHGVKLNAMLTRSQYHSIYLAESILRLAGHPNIKYLAGYRFTGGIAGAGNTHEDELKDAYQRQTTLDATQFDYKFFMQAVSAASLVVDGAINRSTKVWKTSVQGGVEVEKQEGTIDALYAKAFNGIDGKGYLLVTNKSDKNHSLTVKANGKPITAPMMKYFTTSEDPSLFNSWVKPDNITIQSSSTSNPVTVPPYSVTRIEWETGTSVQPPEPGWLMYADPGDEKVSLKWYPVFNADGYIVKYGMNSGAYNHEVKVGNATEYTINGLLNGKTYYFNITTYNKEGFGKVSNEVSVTLSKPDVPLMRDTYPGQSGRAAVEWRSENGAMGYKLKYGTESGRYSTVLDVGNVCGYIVKGLENGCPYYFAVSAYNALGESENSQEMKVIPLSDTPLSPYDLEVESETSSEVKLVWKPAYVRTKEEFFENNGAGNWIQKSGVWEVIKHPDANRNTNVYRSKAEGEALAVFNQDLRRNYEISANVDIRKYNLKSKVGVIAGFKDIHNYYCFLYDKDTNQFVLQKVSNGEVTTLASKASNVINTRKMDMKLKVEGNRIDARLAGEERMLMYREKSAVTGSAGIYADQQEVLFDKVYIDEVNTESYIVLRSTDPYDGYSVIASGITGTSYTDHDPIQGVKNYYKIKSINQQGESHKPSNITYGGVK